MNKSTISFFSPIFDLSQALKLEEKFGAFTITTAEKSNSLRVNSH